MKHLALLLLAIACLQGTHAQTTGYKKKTMEAVAPLISIAFMKMEPATPV